MLSQQLLPLLSYSEPNGLLTFVTPMSACIIFEEYCKDIKPFSLYELVGFTKDCCKLVCSSGQRVQVELLLGTKQSVTCSRSSNAPWQPHFCFRHYDVGQRLENFVLPKEQQIWAQWILIKLSLFIAGHYWLTTINDGRRGRKINGGIFQAPPI